MAKFDKVARKKLMVRFQEIDGKTGVWATCSQAVKDYAEKTFKTGDVVEIQSDTTGEVGLYVTRISKPGQGGGNSSTAPTTGNVPKCEDCGKELKDAKYSKCYTCNQKKPAKSAGGYTKSPEVQESILRQCIANATSRAINALTGQIDLNTIGDAIDVVYDKFLKKVKGE